MMKQYIVSILDSEDCYFNRSSGVRVHNGTPNAEEAWGYMDRDAALGWLEHLYAQGVKAVLTIEPVILEVEVVVESGVVRDVKVSHPLFGQLPIRLDLKDRDV
jgi:hypothetical protein